MLQIVAGAPLLNGLGGGGGGAGAKFWLEAGTTVASPIARASAATHARRMGYYTAMVRRLLILLVLGAFVAMAGAAVAAPAAPGFKVTTIDDRAIDSRELIG